MPLPDFNIDGVLPPFVGPDGPGGSPEDLSPFQVSVLEIVHGLAFSEGRKTILRGWLLHRKALRAIGFNDGFQWIDGSFVEKGKEPKDIDVVTFFRRPSNATTATALALHRQANRAIFSRAQVKAAFHVDFMPIDLQGTPEGLVGMTRYYTSLFSHRRDDFLWKGMLQVSMDGAEDQDALDFLGLEPTTAAGSPP
ncbi:DUF6932 family protein [Bradyrhizobium prioriisuperbiae]|uniref:DUF6932 family protein n=1 Tax=Bradyrhizobium prioriisuperbiae TaxID=2854389 RepID=UPI0028EAA1B8|nr:hypothetical protein [Bradyrhizobium prioritasuperba]